MHLLTSKLYSHLHKKKTSQFPFPDLNFSSLTQGRQSPTPIPVPLLELNTLLQEEYSWSSRELEEVKIIVGNKVSVFHPFLQCFKSRSNKDLNAVGLLLALLWSRWSSGVSRWFLGDYWMILEVLDASGVVLGNPMWFWMVLPPSAPAPSPLSNLRTNCGPSFKKIVHPFSTCSPKICATTPIQAFYIHVIWF